GVMQKGVGVMHRAINGKGVDVLEMGYAFGGFVFDVAVCVQLDQFVFIALVFDQNGIKVQVLILQKQFDIGEISSISAIFGSIIFQCFIYLRIQRCLF